MKFSILKMKDFELNVNLRNIKCYFGIVLALFTVVMLTVLGASMRAAITLTGMIVALAVLEIRCNETMTKVVNGLWMLVSVVELFCFPQLILKAGFNAAALGRMNLALGLLIPASVILLIYLFTRNARVSVIVSHIILLTLSVINYYVFHFKGEEVSPTDIFALETAANVASDYNFFGDISLMYFICIGVIVCFAGFCVPNLKGKFKVKNSLVLAAAEVAMIAVLVAGISEVNTQFLSSWGTQLNGFYVNFLSKLKLGTVDRPENYDEDFIKELEEQYFVETSEANGNLPDIIMIMVESFGDLRVMGDLRTDTEVMPFYDSLQENVIKGQAIVSAYGGGTCKSEFEALTGYSMSGMTLETYPYQQYIKQDVWSVASYLKSLGYETMATHPEDGLNWKRNVVYPYLGFEETKFIEEYSRENLLRGHVSDQAMYEQLISWYEQQKKDAPLFYFGVTMQNHSPYTYEGSDFETSVKLEGYQQEYPDVEQYLTLAKMSDQAFQYLVEYFESVENDVVLVFFGDHMPKLESFYEELKGGPLDTLEDEMNRRTVPFAVWANYDIEEKEIEYTSFNYLSNFVYEAAGIELSAYHKALEDIRMQLPAVSTLGYYSPEEQRFCEWEEMTEAESEVFEKYLCLQYNALLDKNNRSEVFFPLEETE